MAVAAGQGRYFAVRNVAGMSAGWFPATASPASGAEVRCSAVPEWPAEARSWICGTAASAPSTATAGAALPAARATLCACEGAACRPVLRTFRLPCRDCDLTSLPYAGAAPGYSAPSRLSPDLSFAPMREHRRALRTAQMIAGK